MSNPPDIALSFVRLKCHEQEDTELPIVDNEDDEPYIVVLAIDVGTRTLSGGLGGVSPPPFQVFRVGPMEDIDEGDLKPAPANQLWNLDGRPAPMSNPDRTVFAVALLENDNADPLQVTNQARTLLQGTLTQTWINASNRTDLDEPARFEFYTTSARTAFESAIDTARGFSPPGAVLDPDDKLGAPQLLRFSADEHRRVLDHAPSTIERTLHFEGDDAKYDLTFAFHHPGIPGWRAPFPIAPPGHAAPGAITAFSRHPEHIDVFWVGPDGGVGTNFWNQAEGWHQPFPIAPPGHAARGAITAHSRHPEHIDVFWVGPDGGVGTNFWNQAEGWHQPFPIAPPGHAAPGAITAFSRHPEHIDVFWVGPDGGVGTNFWNQAEGWHQPFPIAPPGHAARGAITAHSRHPEHIDVFWVGPDGGVGTNFWNQAEGWHQPFPIAPPGHAAPGGDHGVLTASRAHRRVLGRAGWWCGDELLEPGGGLAPAVPDRSAGPCGARCDHGVLTASRAHRRVLGRAGWWCGDELLEPGGGLAPAVPDRSAGPCGARCDHGVLTASRAHRRVLGRAGWWCRHRVLDGRLILMCVQVETNYPRPSRQATHPNMIRSQARQPGMQLCDHRIDVVEHPIGEFLLPQFIPDMLLRIELGGVSGQRYQANVLGHRQVFGLMRASPVDDHHDEFVGMGVAHLPQKLTHAHGVHLTTDHPVELALQRTDRTVDIHELAFIAVEHDRSPGQRRPTAPGTRHAAEPRFVLEHEPHRAPVQLDLIQDGSQRLGEFFFHASCAARSPLGWRVSGATLRQPCRANSRHTTEAATGRPKRCAKAARIGESTSTPASLACSAHGAKNCFSCSILSSALRRPPHRSRLARGRTDWRKRSCSRGTVARPTPKMAAVCSKVADAKAGSRTAWAARSCSTSVVWATTCLAFTTSPLSIRRGLAI